MTNNSKGLAVVSYITWVGWLIALFMRDKDDSLVKHHLNQALVLNLCTTVCSLLTRMGGFFAVGCGLLSLVLFGFWVWGIVKAANGSEEPLPLFGEIKLLNSEVMK